MQFDTTYTSKNFSKGVNSKQFMILHDTGNPRNPPDINELKYMANNDRVGIHYMIDSKGIIYQFADDDKIVRHAGDWNSKSIGIEVIGYVTFTDAQRESLAKLIKYLSEKYNIGMNYVLRHKDVDPTRRSDLVDEFFHPLSREAWREKLFTKLSIGQGHLFGTMLELCKSIYELCGDIPGAQKFAHDTAENTRKLIGLK